MSEYRERRRRRRRGSGRRQYAEFRQRRKRGWGMGLYRNRRDGKICGVAAGLADYWDVADWVVRLAFIGAFLFTGMLAVWAYVAGAILLSPRPEDYSGYDGRRAPSDGGPPDSDGVEDPYAPEMEYDERHHHYRPRRIFRYSESAEIRLERARERLNEALRRVEGMEGYVTSRKFKLNREFSRL